MKRENKNTINAIHIGVSGFPYGTAPINRCLFVYKAIVNKGVNVLFINNRATHQRNIPIKIDKKGSYDRINYIYTTPSQYKFDSFIKKRISNIMGLINEVILIIKLKLMNKLDIAFYYPDGKLLKLFYYKILSYILGFPIIGHYVEYRSAFESRKKKKYIKFADSFFDKHFTCFVDAILPISEFLVDRINKSNCTKPYLKIPPVTDFNIFIKHRDENNSKYFLYCGSAGYTDAYRFVISSFEKIDTNDFYLHLIINGSKEQVEQLNRSILKSKKSKYIKHLKNLEYKELITQYCNAKALLIPLTSSTQDKARFPQKISEYLAAGNPIITTNFGEIKHYFKNFENALIAENYDIDEYADLMNFVVKEPDKAMRIGMKGNKTGYLYFHYEQYGSKLENLINQLI